MFIVLLKFSTNREQSGDYLDGHKAWLKQGFDDGVFLLAGSLQPGLGGGILARGSTVTIWWPGSKRIPSSPRMWSAPRSLRCRPPWPMSA